MAEYIVHHLSKFLQNLKLSVHFYINCINFTNHHVGAFGRVVSGRRRGGTLPAQEGGLLSRPKDISWINKKQDK